MTSMREKWNYLRSHEAFHRAPGLTVLRLGAWRAHCWLGKPATITLAEWGLRMHLPAEWRGFAKLMFAFRDMYEPELSCLEALLSPGMTFVDVGACYGIYTLVAAKLVGSSGTALAFEPATRSFAVLEDNIALNSLGNVRAYRVALSDRASVRRLYLHPDPSRNSLAKTEETVGYPEQVEANTLDAFLGSIASRSIDVIKMDVEGAEELVLRGARETLSAARPAIIFEVNPQAATALGLSPRGAWEFLDHMGYDFYCLSDGSRLAALRCAPPGGNVVALHPTKIP